MPQNIPWKGVPRQLLGLFVRGVTRNLYLPDPRRSHPWAYLSTGDHNLFTEPYCVSGDVILRCSAGGNPAVCCRIELPGTSGKSRVAVFEHVGFVEERTVGAAQNNDIVLRRGDGGSGHDTAWRISTSPPFSQTYVVLPGVAQKLDAVLALTPPTNDIETIVSAIVLGDGEIEGPWTTRARRQNPPGTTGQRPGSR